MIIYSGFFFSFFLLFSRANLPLVFSFFFLFPSEVADEETMAVAQAEWEKK